jgi:membrane protein YdbS with pleckstrin-like domain
MKDKKELESKPITGVYHHSRKIYIPLYIMAGLLVIFIIYIILQNKPLNIPSFIAAVIFILCIFSFSEAHRKRNSWQVTSRHVIHKHGIFARKTTKTLLETVSDIDVKQNTWERMLNIGTVSLHQYSKGGAEIKSISNPYKLLELLKDKIGRGAFLRNQF